jgi:hypothetical protein
LFSTFRCEAPGFSPSILFYYIRRYTAQVA